MAIFDAFSTLLSILKKGIFVDQKSALMQKTNSELRAMLVGIDKISKLNKKQLIDLLIEKNELYKTSLMKSCQEKQEELTLNYNL